MEAGTTDIAGAACRPIADWREVWRHARRVRVPAGSVVMDAETTDRQLVSIVSGEADVTRRGPLGETVVLRRVGPGDVVGAALVVAPTGRHAERAVAVADVEMCLLSRADCDRLLTPAHRLVLAELAQRHADDTVETVAASAAATARFTLGRLVEHYWRCFELADLRGDHPTFDEIMELYRQTRFLYPAKLGHLATRLAAVEDTWSKLLGADGDVFKAMLVRRARAGVVMPANSVCGFEFADGTWQLQHYVSAERHEYAGTVACLLGLLRWAQTQSVAFTRHVFRRSNPGVATMLVGLDAALGDHAAISDRAHHVIPLTRALFAPHLPVERAQEPSQPIIELLAAALPAVELRSLGMDDLELRHLDDRYRRHGLTRRRTVLTVVLDGRTVGVTIANVSSEGINFSFLENAVEGPFIDQSLDRATALRVGESLLAAASHIYRDAGRELMVVLGDPALLQTLLPADLSAHPTAYCVATVQGSLQQAIDYFSDHYLRLLALEATTAR